MAIEALRHQIYPDSSWFISTCPYQDPVSQGAPSADIVHLLLANCWWFFSVVPVPLGRLLASDVSGVINIWDRRASDLPCLELATNSNSPLNSIKLNADDQVIFGASKQGTIYMWDIRGGRSSAAFQNNRVVSYSPMTAIKLASELERIASLKAQSNIVSKEIHSIDINPSCQNQLAFHLDDGWWLFSVIIGMRSIDVRSGVLDVHSLKVTHIHCPPPPWLDDFNDLANLRCLRKPSWIPAYSIYVVGSLSSNGLYLLDFYPDRSSPCHVDFKSFRMISLMALVDCSDFLFLVLTYLLQILTYDFFST
ncbi:hypothetical protein MTR67_048844 [Solanum verrucosum]|uniref:Transducin/WD40 repeat-like superfamily protein n=1 Tax=Solanum verrucosum TaxID=315347 RepID=A0AAF1A0H2_SOLVR|nr:hypothetical protein MTR67_048844 [Solanum verrucosum]